MSRILVIADVHSNLPALEAVLRHCGSFTSVWFLGDAVDLGPWPRECVERVRGIMTKGVMGNHDSLVLMVNSSDLEAGRTSYRSPFEQWRALDRAALTDEDCRFLGSLPDRVSTTENTGQYLLLHHPYPHGYFRRDTPASQMAGAFEQPVGHDVVLFGHSHAYIDRTFDGVRYLCVPSVGPPRDRDPRAGYLFIEDGEISVHRVDYDLTPLVDAIRELPLPKPFLEKWILSVRTADLSAWHG